MTGAIVQLLSSNQGSKETSFNEIKERKVQKWERTNDQLDDALRQTFPASDALSIIQSVRC